MDSQGWEGSNKRCGDPVHPPDHKRSKHLSTGIEESRSSASPLLSSEPWCHIFLIKPHADFDLVQIQEMLVSHAREICTATESKAKILVRGQGSGHLEVEGVKEAPVHLMVAISCEAGDNIVPFETAVHMMVYLLNCVQKFFEQFSHRMNLTSRI